MIFRIINNIFLCSVHVFRFYIETKPKKPLLPPNKTSIFLESAADVSLGPETVFVLLAVTA